MLEEQHGFNFGKPQIGFLHVDSYEKPQPLVEQKHSPSFQYLTHQTTTEHYSHTP